MAWRGGRPFKSPATKAQEELTANGASIDAIMIVDSDDESSENHEVLPGLDDQEFQEENSEYESSEPYAPFIRTLDLPLGVEVLHLAFPHLPWDTHRSSMGALPSLFAKKIVCAVACSDFSVRVVLLPLLPPSSQSKEGTVSRDANSSLGAGESRFGEEMVVLSSGTTHQSVRLSYSYQSGLVF